MYEENSILSTKIGLKLNIFRGVIAYVFEIVSGDDIIYTYLYTILDACVGILI